MEQTLTKKKQLEDTLRNIMASQVRKPLNSMVKQDYLQQSMN